MSLQTYDNFYINCQKYNSNDTSIQSNYELQYNKPFITNSTEWAVIVKRIAIPTSTIPVCDLTNKTLPFTIVKSGTDYKNDIVDMLPNPEDKIIHNVTDLVHAFNKALMTAYANASIDEKETIDFRYDVASNKIEALFGLNYNPQSVPFDLYLSQRVFSMFGQGFTHKYDSVRKMYRLRPLNPYNYTPFTRGITEYRKVVQEYSSVPNFFEAVKIVVTSNLPTNPEITSTVHSNRNNNQPNANSILFDINYHQSSGRSLITYSSTDDSRRIILQNTPYISGFNINIYYEKIDGHMIPIMQAPGETFSIKLKFERIKPYGG